MASRDDASHEHFADRLVGGFRALGHPLCVGLDPHLALTPDVFRRGDMSPRHPETAAAIGDFLGAVLERLPGRVAVVKPQIAFFEQLGWRGLECLTGLVERARALGLLVLLDAKRGDIGSTADGYGSAYLEPGAACEVDALTLNPYLGLDTLEPFVERCAKYGRGAFVLVKTSNPGSADFQDRVVDGAPLYEVVATALADAAKRLEGPATGWSSLGVVVGATYPDQALRVRERLPRSLFLVPGYGAQGGSARDAMSGFAPGPKGLEGGVVNSSRGILFSQPAREATSAAGWESAFDAALGAAIEDLAAAAAAS